MDSKTPTGTRHSISAAPPTGYAVVDDHFLDKVFFKSSADMSEIPSDVVDLIVTSPPYFCIKDYAQNGHQNGHHSETHPQDYGAILDYANYLRALELTWLECRRVLKPNGKLAVNAPLMPIPKRMLTTHHNRDIFNIYADIERSIKSMEGMFLMDLYVWNRTNPTKRLMFGSYPRPGNLYAQNSAEFIGIFVKEGKPAKHDTQEGSDGHLTQEEWTEYTKQVWNLPAPNRADPGWGEHPALMPEEIPRRLVKMFTRPSGVVLDPFAGSGTTLGVAHRLGRRWAGYEVYRYYEPVILAKTAWEGGTTND